MKQAKNKQHFGLSGHVDFHAVQGFLMSNLHVYMRLHALGAATDAFRPVATALCVAPIPAPAQARALMKPSLPAQP